MESGPTAEMRLGSSEDDHMAEEEERAKSKEFSDICELSFGYLYILKM